MVQIPVPAGPSKRCWAVPFYIIMIKKYNPVLQDCIFFEGFPPRTAFCFGENEGERNFLAEQS